MIFWKRPEIRHAKHLILLLAVVGPAMYFAPIPASVLLLCGAIDVGRHRNFSIALIEEYFTGKGLLTWFLSPVNLLADILSRRHSHTMTLAELPLAHRREVESCVAAFLDNGERIRNHIGQKLKNSKRAMLTFRWFDAAQDTEISIPALARKYRFVKTVAVSAFNTGERTSWHFGPQRLTLRVLRNLDPVAGREACIAVDDQVHYWCEEPLFIFDDTVMHRSINGGAGIRYCLFMDIVRPNHFQGAFDAAIWAMSILGSFFKQRFYKNWAFMR